MTLNEICAENDPQLALAHAALLMEAASLSEAGASARYWLSERIVRYASGRWQEAMETVMLDPWLGGTKDEPDSENMDGMGQDEELFDAFRALGLSPDATLEEVKAAFRKLSLQFHPDVVSSKGLNPEFVSFAEDKFKAINGAYQKLMAAFGES